MKTISFFLIIFLISISGFSQTQKDIAKENDSWIGQDKLKHFTVSAWIGMMSSLELQQQNVSKEESLKYAAGFTLAVGIAKEIYDNTKDNNIFSYKDLIWDCLGITFFLFLMQSN